MKILKGFLRLLLLLLVVFLATGLLVKESSYQIRASIAKPLPQVFSAFHNKSTLKDWQPNLHSIKSNVVKEGVIGSSYHLKMTKDLDTIDFLENTIAFIPNKKITYTLTADQLFKVDDYDFEVVGDSTIITKNVVYKSDHYFMQCLFPYLKNNFIELDQNNLDNFKTYIEKQ